MINICEIFSSLQGESSFSGLPCIFVRLSGCNLRCSYCDTTYCYETKFSLTPSEILKKIKTYLPLIMVEITGGEPLLQPQIYELFDNLYIHGYKILLETNGSILLEDVPRYVHKIVDVKCPGSGEVNSFELANLTLLDIHQDEIKFVLKDYNDYEWAKAFIKKHDLNDYKILFSPLTETLSAKKLAGWIIQDKLNVRLNLQLHKIIWGKNQTGV